ncbi:hypothetical protein [Rhizobium sp. Root1220]|uniref:hypothetical protein n=1 Tax=Rhizobium sp. Root1220 TaxID=1736432 RepID=UPI000700297A|nr:hypothetical protein [Rhizobium sp. Root1220]KQV79628.1 hypothetical protein ASC90_26295 [Rhizobium sp. Root1220]
MAWRKDLTRMDLFLLDLGKQDQTTINAKAITLGEKAERDGKSTALREKRLGINQLNRRIH